jgi:hypothetical protein
MNQSTGIRPNPPDTSVPIISRITAWLGGTYQTCSKTPCHLWGPDEECKPLAPPRRFTSSTGASVFVLIPLIRDKEGAPEMHIHTHCPPTQLSPGDVKEH